WVPCGWDGVKTDHLAPSHLKYLCTALRPCRRRRAGAPPFGLFRDAVSNALDWTPFTTVEPSSLIAYGANFIFETTANMPTSSSEPLPF
ncbi:MAG TPA: hypothetical protein VKC60_09075, partial [Opitutaceae bacterium]|nr:hypothetical protein [Opitutaceae bacterium]